MITFHTNGHARPPGTGPYRTLSAEHRGCDPGRVSGLASQRSPVCLTGEEFRRAACRRRRLRSERGLHRPEPGPVGTRGAGRRPGPTAVPLRSGALRRGTGPREDQVAAEQPAGGPGARAGAVPRRGARGPRRAVGHPAAGVVRRRRVLRGRRHRPPTGHSRRGVAGQLVGDRVRVLVQRPPGRHRRRFRARGALGRGDRRGQCRRGRDADTGARRGRAEPYRHTAGRAHRAGRERDHGRPHGGPAGAVRRRPASRRRSYGSWAVYRAPK